jgi:alpha-L-fucosidase
MRPVDLVSGTYELRGALGVAVILGFAAVAGCGGSDAGPGGPGTAGASTAGAAGAPVYGAGAAGASNVAGGGAGGALSGAGAANAGSDAGGAGPGAGAGGAPDMGGASGAAGSPVAGAGAGGSGGGAVACTAPIGKAATWNDITAAHTVPAWLKKAKLGIQIHWGLYSVPAYHNEWFFQHLYCNTSFSTWTSQNFPKTSPMGGPWGYKDFITGFTAANWDPNAWAALFKKSGAAWVQLSAQHHDRFALWDSALTKWDAKDMGPKRDLVGDLATAVRAQGLKFGVSNHIMYGDSFAYCGPSGTTPGSVGPNTPATVSDLYDPKYADFYGPPTSACGPLAASTSCSPRKAFCDDWLARSTELVDKYQLDVEWFDWDGANVQGSACWADKQAFVLDYYKKACSWGKEVTTAGKGGVFPGSDTTADGGNIMIHDFETGGHAPLAGAEPKTFWMVDDKIGGGSNGNSWGYITGMTYRSASSIISQMDNYTARGGVLVLNISPMADGTIPQAQQDILTEIGKHLGVQ